MSVHTVVFDAGLTLLRVEPSWLHVFIQGAADAGVQVDVDPDAARDPSLDGVWDDHHREWLAAGEPDPHAGDADAEQRFWEGLYRRFLAELGIPGDHSRIAAAIHEAFLRPGVFRPYPEVGEVLDDLQARGVRTGLLSNWGPWLRDVLAHEGLAGRFEVTVVSAEEGLAKPDVRLFQRTLARLGVPPSPEVAYVGDDLRADVAPSRELGLTAVLVDRFQRHADHQGPRVTDLRQLPDVIDLPAVGVPR